MIALEAVGLTYTYGRRTVLSNVALNVYPGEIVGLLGPNGAGKTTAFHLLAGLLKRAGTEIKLHGVPMDGLRLWARARHGLAYVPQSPTLLMEMTVRENIEFGLLRCPSEERQTRLAQAIEEFGLSTVAHLKGSTLSGGERRRVELARAFVSRPRVLLADEPFAALDPMATEQVCRHLRRFADKNVGVLLTDHDVAQALELCDRVYMLHDGQVICVGTPDEVARDPKVRDTYLGERFWNSPAPVTEIARG